MVHSLSRHEFRGNAARRPVIVTSGSALMPSSRHFSALRSPQLSCKPVVRKLTFVLKVMSHTHHTNVGSPAGGHRQNSHARHCANPGRGKSKVFFWHSPAVVHASLHAAFSVSDCARHYPTAASCIPSISMFQCGVSVSNRRCLHCSPSVSVGNWYTARAPPRAKYTILRQWILLPYKNQLQAVRRTHNGESISYLFNHVPM
jgi:hypothetical protein